MLPHLSRGEAVNYSSRDRQGVVIRNHLRPLPDGRGSKLHKLGATELRRLTSLLCLIVGFASAGCATHAKQLTSIRDAYYSGRLDQAETLTVKQIKKSKSDTDVLKLERAMIELSSGRPQQAEQTLREVRDRFDDFEQKDIGEGALSLLTDDTRRAYAGEDYEKVLVRCFLALSSLMRDGSDAVPYALQVGQKQQDIIF